MTGLCEDAGGESSSSLSSPELPKPGSSSSSLSSSAASSSSSSSFPASGSAAISSTGVSVTGSSSSLEILCFSSELGRLDLIVFSGRHSSSVDGASQGTIQVVSIECLT